MITTPAGSMIALLVVLGPAFARTSQSLMKAATQMAMDHAEGALPSSKPLERDARLVSTDHKVAPSEIAIGVIIGRAAEYFDFFVFAIASVLVFPKVFFPFAEPVTATLYSFAMFSLAFVARPVGTIIFTAVDRRHGRGVKLTIALFLLGFSTMAVSFLPGYAQIGAWSLYLLGVLRVGQGVALGGAWDGLASLLALNAPIERRGFYAAIPQLGAPLGFMVAGVLFSFFLLNLTEADFLDWGWRYPFFCAFAINVVAMFSRLRLVATDEFSHLLERRRLEPSPILPLIRNHAPELLVGALVPLASFALFHLVTVFPISWIHLFTQRSAGEFLMVQCSGALICGGAIMASGLIADQLGRRMLLLLSAGLIAVFAVCSTIAPLLIEENAIGQTIYVNAGFALLGLSYGQSSGAVTSRLEQRYRYTGAALTNDLAWLLGAGFAPLIVLFLSARYGLACVGLYLLSGAVTTLIALSVSRSEIRQV